MVRALVPGLGCGAGNCTMGAETTPAALRGTALVLQQSCLKWCSLDREVLPTSHGTAEGNGKDWAVTAAPAQLRGESLPHLALHADDTDILG